MPILTSPKFNPEGSSATINERVRTILADALAVYRVNAEMLRDLRPSVIVTQSQCDACAVSLRDVEDAVAQWAGTRPAIVSLAPYALEDIFADIERVGSALGADNRGREVTQGLRARMDAITTQARTIDSRPSIAIVEWIEPLMAAGHWMPELIAMAGGRNVFGEAGKPSPWMKFEELVAVDPEVIMISPCGFSIERTLQELPLLARRPEWDRLQAVRAGRVFVADGNQYFSRPGPRIAESLEILAELLHPERFSFGHRGAGWRQA